ncbi:MAG: hypothetical protein KA234_01140 [Saprospiraceae bacterium]|nr:hypothetical protein [Saprospiraceae bacterium]
MKELEQEIQDFHTKEAEIATESAKLYAMGKDIVQKYCPYKKGDKVIYTEWWRGNGKDYFGIIDGISFKGISEGAVDKRWIITIMPCTKDWVPIKNRSGVWLGKHKRDVIRKA